MQKACRRQVLYVGKVAADKCFNFCLSDTVAYEQVKVLFV